MPARHRERERGREREEAKHTRQTMTNMVNIMSTTRGYIGDS